MLCAPDLSPPSKKMVIGFNGILTDGIIDGSCHRTLLGPNSVASADQTALGLYNRLKIESFA